MAFLVSPGVLVTEKDLSAIVPAVATTNGATVGEFNWGPVKKPMLISTEKELYNTFGKPNSATAQSFFNAANFLSYSNSMWVVRAETPSSLNAVTGTPGVSILNDDDYELNHAAGQDSSGEFAGKFPGALANGLKIYAADSATFGSWAFAELFQGAPGTSTYADAHNDTLASSNDEFHMVVVDAAGTFSGVRNTVLEKFAFVSKASDAKAFDGTTAYYKDVINRTSKYLWVLDIPTSGLSGSGNAWGTAVSTSAAFKTITSVLTVSIAGDGTGATAVVSKVGTNGEILEITVTGGGSTYTSATATVSGGGGTGATLSVTVGGGFVTGVKVDTAGSGYYDGLKWTLSNGADGTFTDDNKTSAFIAAYDEFKNAESIDISLIPLGNVSAQVAQHVIQNIAEYRKDCVVFVSPADVNNSGSKFGSPVMGNATEVLATIKEFKSLLNVSSSYAFMDSGWKYQFDRYNDAYRWIPLSADMAGICARTDTVADPWWSPGGFNRGAVKSVVKLAVNPDQALRDELYKINVNPVVSFPNQGVVLYGDKTLQAKASAFDRINVRRLFIVLEKAIATAAKYQLFEFNDPFTRAAFRNMVEPFLRDVQGRRGVYDFKVVCDETNNTGEVIDRNEFVADIYIKPARSINYIYLNFIATRTDAVFSELVGAA